MDIDVKKGTVTLYEVKCKLCGEKMCSTEEGGCHELLVKHVDNECTTAKMMRDWEKRGIYKEMVGFIRQDALADKLKKLLRRYSYDEIKEGLEKLEIEETESSERTRPGVSG